MNVAAIAVTLPRSRSRGFYCRHQIDQTQQQATIDPETMALRAGVHPDIYYIVLDGYGREDVLGEIFGIDNSDFTSYLASRGFVVPSQAQANYMQTALSLASSLNLGYMDDLASQLGPRSQDREPLVELVRHSVVRKKLAEIGYEIVALSSGSYFTEIRDADLYLSPFATDLNELEGLWLSTTSAAVIENPEALGLSIPSYESRRMLIRYALGQLQSVGERPGPQFVFAHIIAPHPPFIFDAGGGPVEPPWPYHPGDGDTCCGTDQDYHSGYSAEVAFINSQMMQVIDAILAHSETPPIILVQGDHGPGSLLNFHDIERTCLRERLPILSAYLLPPEGRSAVYPTFTPVNSFRTVFNTVFGTQLPLLPDVSYYSTWERLYDFIDVSGRTQTKCESPSGADVP
jgi:hypothetical protein